MTSLTLPGVARRLGLLVAVLLAATAALGGWSGTAGAADRPTVLVHGYAPLPPTTQDCSGYWSTFGDGMRAAGFGGEYRTVQFYDGDTNCNSDIRRAADGRYWESSPAAYDRDVSIKRLGADLAWWIYDRYTVNGAYVNLVGHSMGGLMMRAAVGYTAAGDPGFPPSLLIARNVTLNTPHRGSDLASACIDGVAVAQCADMNPGSGFLAALPALMGTGAWAAIGSNSDGVVSCPSASWSLGPISADLTQPSRRFCYLDPAYDHGSALRDTVQTRDASLQTDGAQSGPEYHAAAYTGLFIAA